MALVMGEIGEGENVLMPGTFGVPYRRCIWISAVATVDSSLNVP